MNREEIEDNIFFLSFRDKGILSARIEGRTLADIGETFRLTREGARRALLKIHKRFRSFIPERHLPQWREKDTSVQGAKWLLDSFLEYQKDNSEINENTSILYLDFNVRTINGLARGGIYDVRQLISWVKTGKTLPRLGKKSLEEIDDRLRRAGYKIKIKISVEKE